MNDIRDPADDAKGARRSANAPKAAIKPPNNPANMFVKKRPIFMMNPC